MRARIRRIVVRSLVLTTISLGIGYLAIQMTDNFGTIIEGRAYRSAQMTGRSLAQVVRTQGIRTVINLRGPNPEASWYREELAATRQAGVDQVDIAMSSCQWMSRAQLRAVIQSLDRCRYPILIHCQHGSERTGLVSAICTLIQPGSTLEQAKRQFSLRHLFLPIKDGRVMRDHLSQYESWLADRSLTHSPEQFRTWVEIGFRPQTPSREQWPYDPYPLVVETLANEEVVSGQIAIRKPSATTLNR